MRSAFLFLNRTQRVTLIPCNTMSNLTVVIDEETLKRARLRALQQGTSVNELLRKFLESYAGVSLEQAVALEDLLSLSGNAKSRNRGAKRWSRDELHERR